MGCRTRFSGGVFGFIQGPGGPYLCVLVFLSWPIGLSFSGMYESYTQGKRFLYSSFTLYMI